jgi:hypothetical protein
MLVMIKTNLALLGNHHDLFSSRQGYMPRQARSGEQWLRAHDLVYDGVLEAPKGKTARRLGKPVALPLFRSTKFGDDQDRRSRSPTAAGPISAPTSPITSRRRQARTRWSISGAPTTPARSSGSRLRSRR